MKIKILFAGLIWCLSISVTAQTNESNHAADETVNITVSSATVKEWFGLIESKGIILSYNSSMIMMDRQRTVSKGERTVGALLNSILSEYKFKIIPAESKKLILQIEGMKKNTLTGSIKESETGEKLYGAVIIFKQPDGKIKYATSNSNGVFTTDLFSGTYSIEVRYMGYKPHNQRIEINKDLSLNIKLVPMTFALKEVTVKTRQSIDELNESTPSNMISFNSTDFFSKINILPGVINSDASGHFNVNGGNDDENLILLDGIQIYHPNHLNPMLSPLNGDAIKNITFHKNYFPTEYEGRLSSVTDIKIKEGNKQKFMQTLTLDMPAASAVFEGPIIKNKLSYMIGGRRSWLDLFNNQSANEDRLDHSFYDLNAKLSYDINDHSSIQITGYKTGDKIILPNEDGSIHDALKWKNEMYALKFNTFLGKRIINTNTATYSSYENSVYAPLIGFDESKFVKGGTKRVAFSSSFNFNPLDIYTITGGIKLSHEHFDMFASGDSLNNIKKFINQLSFFYDNKIRITDKIYTQLGINFVAYFPHNDKSYYSLQPRFSFKYFFDEKDLLYVGISKMEQFYHSLRIDLLPLPTDFRMPSIMGFIPSTSNHFEAGWKRYIGNGYIESSVYYKRRNNIVAFRLEISQLNSGWSKYIMNGDGKSYGIQCFFYNNWEKFTLQMSYAYSRSKEKYSDLPEKGEVPSLYDIPHSANMALTYKFAPTSSVSIGAILQSGRIKDGDEEYGAYTLNQFRTERRKTRYRIDAAYNFTKNFKRDNTRLMFRIGLYNMIGNPSEEDIIDMYSVNWGIHCLPFGCISFKF